MALRPAEFILKLVYPSAQARLNYILLSLCHTLAIIGTGLTNGLVIIDC